MYKATASGHQFLARAAMHSTKGSRRGFDLLDHGVNVTAVLSDEERRDSLVARVKSLNEEIVKWPKSSEMRKGLGLEISALCEQISAIRKKTRCPGIAAYFITAAKNRLPKAMIEAIYADAKELQAKDQMEPKP